MRFFKVVGLALLGTAFGAGVGLGADRLLPETPLTRGLFIGHKRVPKGVSDETWLGWQRTAIRARTVTLRLRPTADDPHAIERTFTFDELGIDLDVATTAASADAVGHRGKLLERIREVARARRGDMATSTSNTNCARRRPNPSSNSSHRRSRAIRSTREWT